MVIALPATEVAETISSLAVSGSTTRVKVSPDERVTPPIRLGADCTLTVKELVLAVKSAVSVVSCEILEY
jgi:hypothetical protein